MLFRRHLLLLPGVVNTVYGATKVVSKPVLPLLGYFETLVTHPAVS